MLDLGLGVRPDFDKSRSGFNLWRKHGFCLVRDFSSPDGRSFIELLLPSTRRRPTDHGLSSSDTAVGAEIDHDGAQSMSGVDKRSQSLRFAVMPVEFLTDEQTNVYRSFREVPTQPELERFFFLNDDDRDPIAVGPQRTTLSRVVSSLKVRHQRWTRTAGPFPRQLRGPAELWVRPRDEGIG